MLLNETWVSVLGYSYNVHVLCHTLQLKVICGKLQLGAIKHINTHTWLLSHANALAHAHNVNTYMYMYLFKYTCLLTFMNAFNTCTLQCTLNMHVHVDSTCTYTHVCVHCTCENRTSALRVVFIPRSMWAKEIALWKGCVRIINNYHDLTYKWKSEKTTWSFQPQTCTVHVQC